MKVTFYGIGYVGLVQAAVLADAGHDVCCVDVDSVSDDVASVSELEFELHAPNARIGSATNKLFDIILNFIFIPLFLVS